MRRAAEQDIVEAVHLGRQLGVLRHLGDEPGSLAVAETAGRAVREPDVAGRADCWRPTGAGSSCPLRSGRSARSSRPPAR